MRWRRVLVFALVAVVLLGGVALAAAQPRVQNRFGYALHGDNLPYYVYYGNRRYVNLSGQCRDTQYLQQQGFWPLHQVAEVPALLGSPYPIFDRPIPAGFTTTALFVQRGDCYLIYVLDGGP